MPRAAKVNRPPLARQIAEDLRREILSGQFAPGSRLPSEAELCERYGVSRVTVRTAMKSLESQGLVDIRHGSGMYVVDFGGRIRSGLQELRSITETIEELGLDAQVRRISLAKRPASAHEADRLDLKPNDQVIEVYREIRADNQLVAISLDAIPADLMPDYQDSDLGKGSVFAFLDERGLVAVRALAEIHAVRGEDVPVAREQVIDELLILLDQVHYDRLGRPLAHSRTYFVEGRFQFVILRTR